MDEQIFFDFRGNIIIRGESTIYVLDRDLILLSSNRLAGNIISLGVYKQEKLYVMTNTYSSWNSGRSDRCYMNVFEISYNEDKNHK